MGILLNMPMMPTIMSAADLRALYEPPHHALIDADANRIYTLIVTAATQGKLYLDFDVSLTRTFQVINKLKKTFPDVDFIELETLTFRRLYRAIWASGPPNRPPPVPELR